MDGGLLAGLSKSIIDIHRLAVILYRRLSLLSLILRLGRSLDDAHLDHLSGVSLLLSLGGLDSSSFLLLLELLFTDLLLLHLVDRLNKNGLVLVKITLSSNVEVMVDVLGDLLSFSILLEESSKNSLASHPDKLSRHTCVSSTLSLTSAVVSALPFGLFHSLDTGSGVHVNLSLHDETITEEFSNVLS